MSLEDQIEQYVRDSPTMTFVELQNRVGARSRGEHTLLASVRGGGAPDPNLVLWCDTSLEFNAAIISLMAARRIHLTPTSWLVYAYDGEFAPLPIATRPPRKGYRTPHWAPVVLNPGPPP